MLPDKALQVRRTATQLIQTASDHVVTIIAENHLARVVNSRLVRPAGNQLTRILKSRHLAAARQLAITAARNLTVRTVRLLHWTWIHRFQIQHKFQVDIKKKYLKFV
jgi:hypothetical protein